MQLERLEERRQQKLVELMERRRQEEESRFAKAEAQQQQQAERERRLQQTASLKKAEAEVACCPYPSSLSCYDPIHTQLLAQRATTSDDDAVRFEMVVSEEQRRVMAVRDMKVRLEGSHCNTRAI